VAGGGGSGAYAKSIFTPILLNPATVLTVTVGAGGTSGTDGSGGYYPYGGVGGDGKITVVWA
jgi:hypothetical protein